MDNKIIQVALDGLENILKVGDMEKINDPESINRYALYIEECGGMEKIHNLQIHDNIDIYKKSYHIIDAYYADDDDGEGELPAGQEGGQFAFQQVQAPEGGFNFGGGMQ
jgi:hypothetical protein